MGILKDSDGSDFYDKFANLSEVSQWHLAGNLGELVDSPKNANPETNIKLKLWLNSANIDSNEIKLKSPEGRYLAGLIKKIDDLQLKSDAISQEKQKLQNAKEKMKSLIIEVFNDLRSYIYSILDLSEAARKGDTELIRVKDKRRTESHNKLISSINVANRSLFWWFGGEEPVLDSKFGKMYEKQFDKYVCTAIEPVEFGENGIITANYNIKERKQITLWAEQIYGDLMDLEIKLK
ncbi:hypothetical protein GF376_03455 [Candidatus Peregrinibacteria bacterium]|nr:hypothetical protein [Candidatus Peregrinibacteria bacterium]